MRDIYLSIIFILLFIITVLFLLRYVSYRDEKLIEHYNKCLEYRDMLYSNEKDINKNEIYEYLKRNCFIPE